MKNPSAFPVVTEAYGLPTKPTEGMSLRDVFAATALAGMCNNIGFGQDVNTVAQLAFKLADAMLAVRDAK